MNKMRLFNVVIIISILFCLSCGAESDPPMDGAEKLFIKKYITVEDGSKPYKFVGFKKTNTKDTVYPLDAKKAYIVAYTCTIEITNNCYIKINRFNGKDYLDMIPFVEHCYLSVKKPHDIGLSKYKTINKGTQVSIHNILAFRKTEKGWTWLPTDLKEMF